MRRKSTLAMAIMFSLLGVASAQAATDITAADIPYTNSSANGDYTSSVVNNGITSSTSYSAITLGGGTNDFTLNFSGELTFKNTANTSTGTGSGLIRVFVEPSHNALVTLDANSKITTDGINSDGVHIIGSTGNLINSGTITVNQDSTGKVYDSDFGIVCSNGAHATNEGTIITHGTIKSSGVLTGYMGSAESTYGKADVYDQFINNGTIKTYDGAAGIYSLKSSSSGFYSNGAINNGNIEVLGAGMGMATYPSVTGNGYIHLQNAGNITTENGVGIYLAGNDANLDKIILENNSNIKTNGTAGTSLGNAPIGVEGYKVGVTSNGDSKIATAGNFAAGIYLLDNSTLDVNSGTLTIVTQGGGSGAEQSATGIILNKSNANFHVGSTVDVETQGSTSNGIFMRNYAKLTSDGTLKIHAAASGAEGLEVTDHCEINLNGETSINTTATGIAFGGYSKLVMASPNGVNVETLANGINIGGNSSLETKANNILNVKTNSTDGSGIVLTGSTNCKAVLDGKNTIQALGTRAHAITALNSGNAVSLEANSVNNFSNGRGGGAVLHFGGANTTLTSASGSNTTVVTNSDRAVSMVSGSKADLSGTWDTTCNGYNSDAFGIETNSSVDLSGDLTVHSNADLVDVFGCWGGNATVKSTATVNALNMPGNDNHYIFARYGANFISESGNTTTISTTGANSDVILADGNNTTVEINGGDFTTAGTNSAIAYAIGPSAVINLKNLTNANAASSSAYHVEKDGTINLVGTNNTLGAGAISTNTTGVVNADGSNVVGDVTHLGTGNYYYTITNFTSMPVGDLQVNLQNSSTLTGGADDSGAINPLAKINIDIDNSSAWKVTKNSNMRGVLANEGTVNMQQYTLGSYETVTTEDYAGNGTVVFDTDLASETNGDKLEINNGTTATNGTVQVYDTSLATGKPVVGEKSLLLVKDPNGITTWSGKALDTGGIWDVVPTVERGDAFGKGDTNWYLRKIAVEPNTRLTDLLSTFDAGYGVWRSALTDDTLRQRLGDLRYSKEASGLWARMKAGKLGSSQFDSSYQLYQVGIDKNVGNTVYGLAVDHTRTNNSYSAGNGEGSLTNVSLYGTSYHPSGAYSDVVLKAGKLNNSSDTNSTTVDSLDYNTWAYSASYELGKTFTKANGWFVEPEMQLTLGYLKGGDYTSANNLAMSIDGSKSLIGRVGLVAGRKIKDSDYYFKVNLYREFTGERNAAVSTVNNYGITESGNFSSAHRDNWLELGLGGNIKMSDKTYLYGDILKTFSADIDKKWQVNAGMRFVF